LLPCAGNRTWVTRNDCRIEGANIDSKLERVAVQRQLEVDKYNKILAAAAAAAAAEE
jgi:hypothetical protein